MMLSDKPLPLFHNNLLFSSLSSRQGEDGEIGQRGLAGESVSIFECVIPLSKIKTCASEYYASDRLAQVQGK